MGILIWIGSHWFDLFQTAGIIAGLGFTTHTVRLDMKTRRVNHLMEITKQHREIWSELYHRPELARVRDAAADLKLQPVTTQEELFIDLLVLNLNVSYRAVKDRLLVRPEGLRKDIQRFFSRPLAKVVWEKVKPFQDTDFVAFVEDCLSSTDT
jgi:hypothetical protein